MNKIDYKNKIMEDVINSLVNNVQTFSKVYPDKSIEMAQINLEVIAEIFIGQLISLSALFGSREVGDDILKAITKDVNENLKNIDNIRNDIVQTILKSESDESDE